MKKVLACILTLTLALALCACGAGYDPTDPDDQSQKPPEATTPSDQQATPQDGAEEAQVKALCDTLAAIDENTTMGVSGSSLRATQSAGMLLDWAAATTMTAQQIQSATAEWMAAMGNDAQVAFADKLAEVDQFVTDLQGDTAEDMLSCAGYEAASYPWSESALSGVEAVMTAAGLR